MEVETVKVGLKSILSISDENMIISNFIVYYNAPQSLHNAIPVMFNSPYPNLTGSDIKIDKISPGELLQDEVKSFVIAKFFGGDENANKEKCIELSFIKSYIFDNASCNGNVDKIYNLVVQRVADKNKGGLSGGAIAGIIIAYIAVAAGIIVALVYVLVIRKKSQISNEQNSSDNIP